MAKPKIQPLEALIDIAQITNIADRASEIVEQVRSSMLAPESRKQPPTFSSSQLAELCGVDKSKIPYLMKKPGFPSGTKVGARHEWSLAEVRQCVRAIKSTSLRDQAVSDGVVITIANFKGGVGKTTTAASLAQGLSLRGLKTLVIDTDPQGSLTTLFGYLPDTEVGESHTILPLINGTTESVMPAIRPTYWDGIDLVSAAPFLFNAEFMLPSRQMKEQGFEFWKVLDRGLEEAREFYDVIIIDSPPSLSYITVNALVAAQGIVMPLPPNALDFASSAQFWGLFSQVCGDLFTVGGQDKKYAFINVLLSRVDRSDVVSVAVREWIVSAYGNKVLPIEIPKTAIAATASAEFGTVYDMNASSAQRATLKRALDAYDLFVDHIFYQIQAIWASDAKIMQALTKEA